MKYAVSSRMMAVIIVVGSLSFGCKTSDGGLLGTVDAPQFSPAAGSYQADQSVAIGCATSGAEIHYTKDGSDPTVDSPTYSGPISVAGDGTTMTIKAVAIKVGMTDSAEISAFYAIDYGQVATPRLSPSSGVYSSDQSVSIDCATSGATIHYTKDGSAPTASSPTYSIPIVVGGDGASWTVQAIAIKSGMTDSAMASAFYAIDYGQVSTPQFNHPAGVIVAAQSVSISSSTSGAAIHYTLDGSEPTAASPTYSSPIPVAGKGKSLTVKAIAIKDGMADSTVASVFYLVDYGQVSVPTFSPAAGVYEASQNIAISCGTKDTVVFYTIDGSDPETNGILYTGPVQVAKDTTIRAIAYDYRTDLAASDVADAQYLFIPPATSAAVSATAADYNKATVTWDPAANAESYNVYYKLGSGVTVSNGIVISNATSPCTIPGLATDKYYSFIVTAKNKNGEGKASAAVSAKAQGHWEVLGSAGFSDGVVVCTEIAVAPNGTVYVLYLDNDEATGYSRKATVKKYGSGNWTTVGSAGFSAGGALNPCMAIDSNNVVYAAYQNTGNGFISVQKFDGAHSSTWEPVGSDIDGIATAIAVNAALSLAIAPDATPYIAFSDQGAGGKATVMKLNGGAWEAVGGIAGISDYPVFVSIYSSDTISLAISEGGRPFVAYGETVDANTWRLVVKSFSGSAWSEGQMVTSYSEIVKIMTDSEDVPYVGFTRQVPAVYGTNDRRPRMMKYRTIEGTTRFFGLLTNTASSDDPLVYEALLMDYSIAVDADDAAYAAFSPYSAQSGAIVRRYNAVSNEWEGVGLEHFSASGTANVTIAIDKSGNAPYVAFVDGANGSKATVMAYK